MIHRFLAALLISCCISIFLTFVVPIYNIARNPSYSANFAYISNGRTWLVDQRFGSRTFVLATESPVRLGVIAVPILGEPYRFSISESDSNLVIIQQEIGWPFISMFWRARYSDLPEFNSPDPMPTNLAIGSRGFGDAFEIVSPGGRTSYFLYSAYWPGSFSYVLVCVNVVVVASTIVALWMATVLIWPKLKRSMFDRRCANCGYPVEHDSGIKACPECGQR